MSKKESYVELRITAEKAEYKNFENVADIHIQLHVFTNKGREVIVLDYKDMYTMIKDGEEEKPDLVKGRYSFIPSHEHKFISITRGFTANRHMHGYTDIELIEKLCEDQLEKMYKDLFSEKEEYAVSKKIYRQSYVLDPDKTIRLNRGTDHVYNI